MLYMRAAYVIAEFMSETESISGRDRVAVAVLLLVALWLRFPFVGAGLPYFYDEDEAHHFNRVVNMVKTGSWNPQYFHKPSLHFYLRMPVVAASFLWSVKKGYLRKVEEIRTRDTFGVGDYAFTASHEGIVRWNRAFSLSLSLLLVMTVYFLARRILKSQGNPALSFAAALPAVFSPDLVRYSAFIGVDILMALLCAAAVLSAYCVYSSYSLRGVFFCGLIAGLAVSSKYNALPIVLMPAAVVFAAGQVNCRSLTAAFAGPAAGFLAGSPFILVSLPLFLNQFAYEIWHYGVEGHAGHMAEPGLHQLLFYLRWLGSSALGWGFLVLAAAGIVGLISARQRSSGIALVFPLCFGLLMCMQKANFERNMLVIVPFLGIFAAVGISALISRFRPASRSTFLIIGPALLCSVQPFIHALEMRRQVLDLPESRRTLESVLEEYSVRGLSIAVAGQLQMPPRIYSLPGVVRVDQNRLDTDVRTKFDVLAAEGPFQFPSPVLKDIPGEPGPQRVRKNPHIMIFSTREGG